MRRVYLPLVDRNAPAEIALKITGNVDRQMAWADAEIKAMPTMEVWRANKDGVMEKYIGVSVAGLLALAGPRADATTVDLVAADSYTADVPLVDLLNCTNCIVAFRSQGGFSFVAPGMSIQAQVKGLIKMQVK